MGVGAPKNVNATIAVRGGEQFLRHLSAPAWPAKTRMRRKEGAPKIVLFKCIATDRAPRHSLHQKSNTVNTSSACDARRLFAECSAEHPESCGPTRALHPPLTNWCAAPRQPPSLRRMLSPHCAAPIPAQQAASSAQQPLVRRMGDTAPLPQLRTPPSPTPPFSASTTQRPRT